MVFVWKKCKTFIHLKFLSKLGLETLSAGLKINNSLKPHFPLEWVFKYTDCQIEFD